MQLEGKTIAVTGASGGIGVPLVELLREKSATVLRIGRGEQLEISGDLSSETGIREMVAKLSLARPDILVNLAGLPYCGRFESQPEVQIAQLYHVNLIAPVQLAQAVLPGMLERGSGMVVNVGSILGCLPLAYFATYASSKAGLEAFSRALRRELRDTPVKVLHIAPRGVKTTFNAGNAAAVNNATKAKMDSPEMVAACILKAMETEKAETRIGFIEGLFARIQGLFPTLFDTLVAGNDRKALAAMQYPK